MRSRRSGGLTEQTWGRRSLALRSLRREVSQAEPADQPKSTSEVNNVGQLKSSQVQAGQVESSRVEGKLKVRSGKGSKRQRASQR